MVYVGVMEVGFSDNRGVRVDEYGNVVSIIGRMSVVFGVESDVVSDDNGVMVVLGRRFDLVDGVEEGVGVIVVSIDGVNIFNVFVVIEELYEDRFDGFGFVENGFGIDFEVVNRGRIDIVVFEEV